MNDYLVIKKASLAGPGIYRHIESGEEFTVWKFLRFDGSSVYENHSGKRYATILACLRDAFPCHSGEEI